MARVYVYVDGESHFIRSEQAWREISGEPTALLEAIRHTAGVSGGISFPSDDRPPLRIERRSKFFWDSKLPLLNERLFTSPVHHAVYFTSAVGDDTALHEIRSFIRSNGFEPYVIKERADLAQRRTKQIADLQLLDKPKGVDIAMAARVLEDAYRGLFDRCVLLTSDIDYLPVIRSIQQLGKKVVVFGYRQGIGKESELEHVPDHFLDLNEHMKRCYAKPQAV